MQRQDPTQESSSAQKRPSSPVDFEIVKESWSDYELEDGSVIRCRPVLAFLILDEDRIGFRIASQFFTLSPPRLCDHSKARSPAPLEELQKCVEKANLKFSIMREGESVYKVAGRQLELRIVAKRFDKTGLHDLDGQPQYIITSTTEMVAERALDHFKGDAGRS